MVDNVSGTVTANILTGSMPQSIAQAFTGTGVNDNDLLFTSTDVSIYNTFELMSTVGAVDVEVTLDGVTYSTAPLALEDQGSAAVTTYVLVTVALRVYRFTGKYANVRVRQNGATAATATLRAGVQ